MAINNDNDFKGALAGLSASQQRLAAARFAEQVLALSPDTRLKGALSTALQVGAGEDELADAYRTAKTASVESYTQCGKACDWAAQAGHFVAEAVMDCLRPDGSGGNCAWEAAMHARMARTSHGIAEGEGTVNNEAAEQYRILTEILNA